MTRLAQGLPKIMALSLRRNTAWTFLGQSSSVWCMRRDLPWEPTSFHGSCGWRWCFTSTPPIGYGLTAMHQFKIQPLIFGVVVLVNMKW
jgi:hypothetical protein